MNFEEWCLMKTNEGHVCADCFLIVLSFKMGWLNNCRDLPFRIQRLISRCALNRTESHNAATSSSVIDTKTKKWSSLGQDGQITDIKAAYVHIPFCRSRCHYCDFPIEVVGSGQRKLQDKAAAYTELIIREIDATASSLESYADGVNTELSSIFFGGGTPSLMPPHHLERIVKRLSDSFGISNDAEISMEADPGTFDAHRVNEWIEAVGITSIPDWSVGLRGGWIFV